MGYFVWWVMVYVEFVSEFLSVCLSLFLSQWTHCVRVTRTSACLMTPSASSTTIAPPRNRQFSHPQKNTSASASTPCCFQRNPWNARTLRVLYVPRGKNWSKCVSQLCFILFALRHRMHTIYLVRKEFV